MACRTATQPAPAVHGLIGVHPLVVRERRGTRDTTWYAALALGVYGAAVVLVTIVYPFVPEDALSA